MNALTIILGIFMYLIVGRIYANLVKDDEYENAAITIFFGIIIAWKIITRIADELTKILFEKQKRSKNTQETKTNRQFAENDLPQLGCQVSRWFTAMVALWMSYYIPNSNRVEKSCIPETAKTQRELQDFSFYIVTFLI